MQIPERHQLQAAFGCGGKKNKKKSIGYSPTTPGRVLARASNRGERLCEDTLGASASASPPLIEPTNDFHENRGSESVPSRRTRRKRGYREGTKLFWAIAAQKL